MMSPPKRRTHTFKMGVRECGIILLCGVLFCMVSSSFGFTSPTTSYQTDDNEYNCTFSLDVCGWTQAIDDDFNWTRHAGRTASRNTGPNTGHTSTSCLDCRVSDYYMYIESSAPRQTSDKARLVGPLMTIPVGESLCFTFWYHMYGIDIGHLSLYELRENMTTLIWTQIGNQGQKWLDSNVTIQGTGRPTQILIDGVIGSGYDGDIAIDDTNLQLGPCGGTASPYITGYPTTTSYPGHNSQLTPVDRGYASIRVDCNKYTWNISIDLNQLRQDYPTAKGSDIYLGENKCAGQERNNLLIFNQELTECLTSEALLNGVHVYNNELIYAEHDPVYAYIIRHYNWTIGVECDVQRDGTVKSSLQNHGKTTPSPSVNNQQYPVHIIYYSDTNFMHEIQGNPLHTSVGSPVYVKVFTTTFDWNMKMRMRTCYTTPTEHALDHLKYYLIRNGCEVDTNTHIISQSTHETRFVFDNFEYTSSHDGLYVYCDATFCDAIDRSTECSQSCHPVVRRRR